MKIEQLPKLQASETRQKQSQTTKGMVLMVFAMLTLPVMDVMAKSLTIHFDVSAGQTTFSRFFIQVVLMGCFIISVHGARKLLPSQLGINLLRGAIMSMAVMVFYITLKYMPVTDALAIFFLEPFILTVMSVIFLNESVGWRRGVAVLLGFVGAMFIIQPSYQVFGLISLLPVCTAFLFAIYLILTRHMASKDNAFTMQFASGIGGVLMLSIVVSIATWAGFEDIAVPGIPKFGISWLLLFCIGALATIGHVVIVMAFRMASASILAPLQYLEIVTGTILGYWIFGDFPDAYKWLGILIIVFSGIYLFLRERKSAFES